MDNKKYIINVNNVGSALRIPITLTETYEYDGLYADVEPLSTDIINETEYTDGLGFKIRYNMVIIDDQYVRLVLNDPKLVHLFSIGESLRIGNNAPYNGYTVLKIEKGSLYVKSSTSFVRGVFLQDGYLVKDAVASYTEEEYVITGKTSSKFRFIVDAFNNSNYIIGEEVKLKSVDDFWGKIFIAKNSVKKYQIHSGGKAITYIDNSDGTTTFTVVRDEQEVLKNQAVRPVYHRMLEEPKIINNLFIDRGVNTAFEPLSRLHSVKNIRELEKNGFNYFKVNKTGFDFK